MERIIIAFHQDAVGDWVADLDCGHTQHVRHAPPLVAHPWVTSESGRREHIGAALTCRACQRRTAGEPAEDERALRIATAVKFECLRAAVESYDDARIRGLCQEGAWDLAMDALKSIDIAAILKQLPD